MPGKVIDVTPTISNHRGDEIDAWLNKHSMLRDYVIIDDLDADNFNKHQINHLYVVNPYVGLDEETARRVCLRSSNRY